MSQSLFRRAPSQQPQKSKIGFDQIVRRGRNNLDPETGESIIVIYADWCGACKNLAKVLKQYGVDMNGQSGESFKSSLTFLNSNNAEPFTAPSVPAVYRVTEDSINKLEGDDILTHILNHTFDEDNQFPAESIHPASVLPTRSSRPLAPTAPGPYLAEEGGLLDDLARYVSGGSLGANTNGYVSGGGLGANTNGSRQSVRFAPTQFDEEFMTGNNEATRYLFA